MVQPLEQKKRQKILTGVLIIALIVTAFVWYSSYRKKPSVEEFAPTGEQLITTPLVIEEKIKEIKLDISVLDDALFKSLKSHGALPVTVGETGRENPFEPY
jgi:hypothetical protein